MKRSKNAARRHQGRTWLHEELERLRLLSYNRELLRVLWGRVLASRADPADELHQAARRVDLRELSALIEEADLAYDYLAIDWFLDEAVTMTWHEAAPPGPYLYREETPDGGTQTIAAYGAGPIRMRPDERGLGEVVEGADCTVLYKRPYTRMQCEARRMTYRKLVTEKAAQGRQERDREIEDGR